jgi:hypothetical protein
VGHKNTESGEKLKADVLKMKQVVKTKCTGYKNLAVCVVN